MNYSLCSRQVMLARFCELANLVAWGALKIITYHQLHTI